MVESVVPTPGPSRLERLKDTPARVDRSLAGAMPGLVRATGDTVELSATALAMPEELRSGPPVDLQLVQKIKDAIADGKYPIDLERITDALFSDYLDLKP
ncbi:flagellar biosynthesis anti-sigma factor FlgM [Cereibacter sphaeroides]|uniref:flagellar biosynthesis anti-sigma factor FlgM n=1 Tax=Cereibacter sphaeroides TaxID=1063 RepID=UPI001F3E7AE8|nr:flagellar biosynthesis anti-sigma factor FlgM [Cereibacter sphaeroides]MCE6952962.1 flagellar biosynthesis anti-sigma factor FlgM [Cereibacter sphaeroides]